MRATMDRPRRMNRDAAPGRRAAGSETTEPMRPDARHTFRVRNSWVDGGRTRSMIADYDVGNATRLRRRPFVVMSDEPETLLGTDTAPSAAEFLLHALAACLTTTLVRQAEARGVTLHEVHTRVEGTLSPGDAGNGGGAGVMQGVRVSFDVKADARPREIEELMLLAQRHSPAFDLLANPVPVTVVRAD